MEFSFYSPGRIRFGQGARKEIGKLAKVYGEKCLIVRTPLRDNVREKYFAEITNSLSENGIEYVIFDQVQPNPTIDIVDKAKKKAIEESVDFVLAFGGGSSIDTAKAVALMAYNKEYTWGFCFEEFSNPFSDNDESIRALPVLAINTTAGTGSQVTQAAVITNPLKNEKNTLFHSCLFPKLSIIDPELMVTVSEKLTAITGFDALSHAIESYFNPRASMLSTTLSLQAVTLIVQTLPKVIRDLENVELRERVAYADYLAGICLSNAGAEAPHPIGEIINGYYPEIAHGETLAFVYPSFFKSVSKKIPEKMEVVLQILKEYAPAGEHQALDEKATVTMKNFLKAIDLSISLTSLAIPEDIIHEMKERLCFNLPLTDSKGMQEILINSL